MADSHSPAGRHEPIWLDGSPETDYDALTRDLDVDVAVVGGGIVGITAAAKLTAAGRRVAVLERDRIVEGVTGHTTAKLTSLHGLIYDHLLAYFGEEQARQYARANEAAIDDVEETIDDLDADCEFRRLPAYTYVTDRDDRKKVRTEVEAARQVGLPASFVEGTDLPYDVEAAIRVDDQAQFDPREYLLALAEHVVDEGGRIFEETPARDVDGGTPCTVQTDRGRVTAESVIVATHFPIVDPALYFARLSPKRSYVLAARLNDSPPEGMYYDPTDPHFSVRPTPTGDESLVLLGGQNHRTGHGHGTTERYRRLERQARDRFDVAEVEYRWSTQDYVSIDRVPFVGSLGPRSERVLVATGFGGWGMTNGTAAGRILADRILGRENPWADVYRPNRYKLRASTGELLSHNRHAIAHLVEDRVRGRPPVDVASLNRGEARVFEDQGDPVGAYRDERGVVHAVSAVCPHMGCLVNWNDGERSWDCPCHGSRFDHDGTVLDAPAVDDLDPVDVTVEERIEADD